MSGFTRKTAIVTGSASGIGRAAAFSFARRGANVVVSDINASGAEEVAADIRSEGAAAIAAPGDISAENAFELLADAAVSEFGQVDIIMNNAGVLTRGLPEHVPLDEWRRVLEINLFSVVRSNAVFIPRFLEQGSGHIVNTASFAGLFTYSFDRLPYAASKAAIVQMSEGLALYLRPKGIGVTLLCPGPTRTNISVNLRHFGPDTETRGPGKEFPAIEPEVLAEKLADAMEAGEFMVYGDDLVREKLIERATDWNAFIDREGASI